ncbi:uncharacterized protein LOC129601570 [Paramacrobiotus metropolitanus]|uniref:uncharacterized protein LOC129601570 n=1 Tax=Paramacrobiotus metropolitanus TaxID=2943436 RepID=UPI0024461EAF|nr:uncharacterized protein LOC129601570 [Paramacrobiotus metropolitanus]
MDSRGKRKADDAGGSAQRITRIRLDPGRDVSASASGSGEPEGAGMTVQATVASSTTDGVHPANSRQIPPRLPPAHLPVADAHLTLGALLALLRQDFIPSSTEMALYLKVMKWLRVDYPTRWTAENFRVVLAELRRDLIPDMLPLALLTATGPLRDVLLELQARLFLPDAIRYTAAPRERHFIEVACLFYTDRHQTSLRLYDAHHNTLHRVPLPVELQTWNVAKMMGPVVDNRVWFRVEHGKERRAYALTMKMNEDAGGDPMTTEIEGMFKGKLTEAASPLVSLNGLVYGWRTNADSYTFNPDARLFGYDVRNPNCLRKEAASDVWNNRYVIILGGYPATGEMYDAVTNLWSEMPAMLHPRCSFAAKVLNGYLYVTGGVGPESAVLRSCDRLQLGVAGAQWQPVPNLVVPRYGHCMFALNDQLFVCGGSSRLGVPLPNWEKYDVAANRWSIVHPLEDPQAASSPVSACVTLTVHHKMLRR